MAMPANTIVIRGRIRRWPTGNPPFQVIIYDKKNELALEREQTLFSQLLNSIGIDSDCEMS